MSEYQRFIESKRSVVPAAGFEPRDLPECLFPFQRSIVEWAVRRGRAALFEDCGLGKTLQQLAWAHQVMAHTDRPVIILAPLAVAGQTVREGERFGLPCVYAPTPDDWRADAPRVVITNYERLPAWLECSRDFAGVVLDESSILKSFMGKTKRTIIESFARTPYRLACTATPAPNDHQELGNHAEFLGAATNVEMLSRWFVNDLGDTGTWRLKAHAVEDFWDWVCSWAAMCGKPSDIGYSDAGYALPSLNICRHIVDVDVTENRGAGELFRKVDLSATSLHVEKRISAPARAARVASLVASEPDEPWVVWCETNYEADVLCASIKEAVDVRGNDSATHKERALRDFTDGKIRVLVTKPDIAGFGLNWQHCARVAFVGATYSFESYYQAIRRCWRFGQDRPVNCHVVMAATEEAIWTTVARKQSDHLKMQESMFAAARRAHARHALDGRYNPRNIMRIPAWLRSE